MDHRIIQIGLIDDEDIVLDHAALALAAVDRPACRLERYETALDEIGALLTDVGRGATSASPRADALSKVLAGTFGFASDRQTYDDPDNADLMRVIDRRQGLPISLSILYVASARRMGWQADALDIPGHVLVLIGDDVSPVVVDPFRGGIIVSSNELLALVSRGSADKPPAVREVAAMSNRSVLIRLLQNQASRAEGNGKAKRALALYERMTTFAPSYGNAWWERARLELIDGRTDDARASLSAMLEITREPQIRSRIVETLTALAGR